MLVSHPLKLHSAEVIGNGGIHLTPVWTTSWTCSEVIEDMGWTQTGSIIDLLMDRMAAASTSASTSSFSSQGIHLTL